MWSLIVRSSLMVPLTGQGLLSGPAGVRAYNVNPRESTNEGSVEPVPNPQEGLVLEGVPVDWFSQLLAIPHTLHQIYGYSSGPLYLLGRNFHKDKELAPSYDRANRNGSYQLTLVKGLSTPYAAGNTYSVRTKENPETMRRVHHEGDQEYNPHGGRFVVDLIMRRGLLPVFMSSSNGLQEIVLYIHRGYYSSTSREESYHTQDLPLLHTPYPRIHKPEEPHRRTVLFSFHPINYELHGILRTMGLQVNPSVFRTEHRTRASYYTFDSSKPIYLGPSRLFRRGLLLHGLPPLTKVQLDTPLHRVDPHVTFHIELSLTRLPRGSPEFRDLILFLRTNPDLARTYALGSMMELTDETLWP